MASAKPIEYVVRLKDLASTGLNRIGKNAKKAANEATTAFKKAEAQLKLFGKAAIAAVSATFLIGLKKGVDRAREFEKAMAEVNTILGEGSLSMGSATAQVERLALELGKPAPELAAGMYQTLSAGVTDSTQALILLEGATKAGIAGLSTTTEAVDLLTTKFNAYGETVTEQAVAATNDLIFKTIRSLVGGAWSDPAYGSAARRAVRGRRRLPSNAHAERRLDSGGCHATERDLHCVPAQR